MKFRHLLLSLLAVAAFSATSCQEEEKDLGLPEIKISQNELALDQGVGTTTLNVYATRNWTVSTTADWIAVNPAKGAAYSETTVTVTVLENESYNRTGTVKFDIGYDSKTLTIKQTGAQGEKSEGSGTVEDPYTVAGVLAFLETLGTTESENVVYVKGKVTAITEAFSAQYGNGTFTITDDGNGSSSPFTAYRVLYLGNKKWTASNPALAEGDDVIVAGKVINYNGKTPETVQGTGYVYSHNGNTAGGGGSDAGDPEGDGTLENPYNVAGIIQYTSSLASDATSDKDVYFSGVITSVGTIDTGFGNGTFYIGKTKDSETTFYCYRAMYLGNTKFTSTDQIKVGDEVVMCGKVTNYKGNTPETVQSKAYIYKLNGETGNTGGGGGDTGDVIFSEDLESSQGNFTIDNKSLGGIEKVWVLDATYKCMKATGYANSTNYATESWLVSPEIDLTSQTTAFLTFDHAGKYFSSVDKAKEETTLRISADGGNTWDAVAIPTYYALDFKFVSSGEISLASYVGKKIKIAFRYVSTAEKAGTWEVNHVKVYKTSTGGGTGGGGGDTTETYFSETFETSQGGFTVDNKTLPSDLTYVWKHDATNKYMKASAYANSTKYATESWLISPEIDLTAATTAFLSFDHVMRYFGTANQDGTLKVTADNGTTWTDVTIPTYPDGSSWTFVSSGEISLASVVGKKIKLAFIYKSSTDAAATWEIKNVKVYKTSTGGNTGGGGGGDTGNGITLTTSSSGMSFAEATDNTYGKGYTATSSDGYKVSYFKHQSNTNAVAPSDDHIRVYQSSVIVVEAPSGKTIKGLVFNCTPDANGKKYANDITVLEGGTGKATADQSARTVTWSGSANKFVGQATAQCRIMKIVVTAE